MSMMMGTQVDPTFLMMMSPGMMMMMFGDDWICDPDQLDISLMV
jgi:hypothetical protein